MKAREYENINGYTQLINTNYEDEKGSGTSDYKDLSNKPKINNVELKSGNNTFNQLGIQEKLTPGENITIENNVISSSGGGGNANLNVDSTNEYATISNNVETINFDLANEKLIVAKPNIYYKEISLGGGTWGNWNKGQDVTGWNYMYRLDTKNMLLECFMSKTLNIGCTATSGNFYRSEPVYIDHLKEFSDNIGLGKLEILDVNINVIKSGYPVTVSFNSINSSSSDFDLSFYLVSGGSRNATNYDVMVHFMSTIESY